MKCLYKIFIKDYKNVNDEKVRNKYGILAGAIGIVLNIILVIFKLIIGLITNSISIIGDALNNMGDTMSSFINVFSFKINSKPADKEHPYGHRRSEYIGSLFISVLIIFVAIELATSSIDKIINPTFTSINWYILLILVINIIVKTFMVILYKDSAKRIDSLSLKASYKDSLNDILMTFIIVIGLYTSLFFNFDIDGYLGVVLSIFIAYSGIKLIKEAIDKLMGESLDNEVLKKICNTLETDKDVIGIHDVLTHQYGEGKVFMSVHVEMDANYSLIEAHEIVDRLERTIKNQYKVELLIHIDPIDFNDKELNKIKKIVNRVINEIDNNLSCHDIRLSLGEDKRLYFDLVLPYSYQSRTKEIVDIVVGEINRHCKYKTSIEINYK